MNAEYYITKGGKPDGPYTREQLHAMWREGVLSDRAAIHGQGVRGKQALMEVFPDFASEPETVPVEQVEEVERIAFDEPEKEPSSGVALLVIAVCLTLFVGIGGGIIGANHRPPPSRSGSYVTADAGNSASFASGQRDGYAVGSYDGRTGRERRGNWAYENGLRLSGGSKEYANGYRHGYNEGWHAARK